MLTFLFWNLMGNRVKTWEQRRSHLQTHLTRISKRFEVDVLVLAESKFSPSELVTALTEVGIGEYCFPPSRSRSIQICTRLSIAAVTDQFRDDSSGHVTIRRVRAETMEILLVAAHCPSLSVWSRDAQTGWVQRFRQDITNAEEAVGHERTLLVGDLNMSPFDPGVTSLFNLNAVMTRDLVRDEGREVDGQRYRFFYNPMWGCFGDRTAGPPGSYFNGRDPATPYWFTLDQVLLRPKLMNLLSELQILDHDGEESLVTKSGRPKQTRTSDHLPLLFRLNV